MGNVTGKSKSNRLDDEMRYSAGLFKLIQLHESDIDSLYAGGFHLIEPYSLVPGTVSFSEFYTFFGLQTKSNILSMIFEWTNNCGAFNFLEFVCFTWNFLTLDSDELQNFVVYLHLGRSSGKILLSEIEDLLGDIQNGKLQ